MFNVLIDTCVWLDLAKDHKQQALLDALEQLVKAKEVELILPSQVVDEFARNKARIIKESSQSLSSTLKRVREVVQRVAPRKGKRSFLRQLSELDHQLPSFGERAVETIGRVEALFQITPTIDASHAARLRAMQRGIDKRAPFHKNKNSSADALLIEMYAEAVSARPVKGERFAFVTHNVQDFSASGGNHKLPHPDIASLFSARRSLYQITLGETLRRVSPSTLSELMIEQEWYQDQRRLQEILNALDLLVDQVWYNRHKNREYLERVVIRVDCIRRV
ncbi:MAG: PIN domain-containing protein [Reyranellaceae bacterium]